ncbi:MAG: diaminopimelate epimerase [Pseudanabaenaceae cyanobacterium]
MQFSKYQGLGNDFILVDNRQQGELLVPMEVVPRLCDRHFGIGADGIIFLLQEGEGRYRMRIINSDGSEPEMCGNGIRCLAQFMQDLGIPSSGNRYFIQTLAGEMVVDCQEGMITVDMGVPRLVAQAIPTTLVEPDRQVINVPLVLQTSATSGIASTWQVTCVNMGNPHCVSFVNDVDSLPLAEIGPLFEHHPAFPQRVNAEFAQILDRHQVKMRVWERGAGITLACGTGACATVVAAVLNGFTDRACAVHLPGGTLKIHWEESSNHVFMSGTATKVFTGEVSLG